MAPIKPIISIATEVLGQVKGSNVKKVFQKGVTNYSKILTNAAQATPDLKATTSLWGLHKMGMPDEFINAIAKNAGDAATIQVATKTSKLDKGAKMYGLVVRDGSQKVVAKGAAKINPNAGQAPSFNLKLRAGGEKVNAYINPNNLNASVFDDFSTPCFSRSKGTSSFTFKAGDALKVDAKVKGDDLFDLASYISGSDVKKLATRDIEALRKMIYEGKNPTDIKTAIQEAVKNAKIVKNTKIVKNVDKPAAVTKSPLSPAEYKKFQSAVKKYCAHIDNLTNGEFGKNALKAPSRKRAEYILDLQKVKKELGALTLEDFPKIKEKMLEKLPTEIKDDLIKELRDKAIRANKNLFASIPDNLTEYKFSGYKDIVRTKLDEMIAKLKHPNN